MSLLNCEQGEGRNTKRTQTVHGVPHRSAPLQFDPVPLALPPPSCPTSEGKQSRGPQGHRLPPDAAILGSQLTPLPASSFLS